MPSVYCEELSRIVQVLGQIGYYYYYYYYDKQRLFVNFIGQLLRLPYASRILVVILVIRVRQVVL